MSTSSLPDLLCVEKRNVFVTQSEQTRQRKEENDNHVTFASVQETDLKTLKNSQVVRKQEELNEVDIQLAVKRQEFNSCFEVLAQRRSELETQQQQAQEKTTKFERFVEENEVKRSEALKRCEATREQNILKQREIEALTEELKQLRARKQVLTQRIANLKIYEDYLTKTLDHLPSIYHDSGYESVVMPIIRRYETLSTTHQELLQRFQKLGMDVEQGHQQLRIIKQQNSIRKLMASKELSDLQTDAETLKDKNMKAEVNLTMQQDACRETVVETQRLLMAIKNLAQQCYLPAFGPLESMTELMMMDMVKEYILDMADTEKRVRRKMESSLATTSTAALMNQRGKGSLKSIGNKTLLKSPSVSRKSETSS
uniref:DUF4200 domain-containing protein n=1 Tax=Iconisemion striatum TaxID=60296 RepID=A0A1A7WQD6_9TELE